MQHLIGTWRGVSTTIPDYLILEDILRFNSDSTIDYEAAAPDGKKWKIRYTVQQDGRDTIIFPEKGTAQVKRDGYRVRILPLDDSRISLTLNGRETIYERAT